MVGARCGGGGAVIVPCLHLLTNFYHCLHKQTRGLRSSCSYRGESYLLCSAAQLDA